MSNNSFSLQYHYYNENSILIEWPKIIDAKILEDINIFKLQINVHHQGVYQTTNAYQSLLIRYINPIEDIESEISELKKIYSTKIENLKNEKNHWKIPVCYEPCFAPDLKMMSTTLQLSETLLIERHYNTTYTVFFIGFLPGFLYLGGLDDSLTFPRKSIPRQKVSAGAVCIGGSQTGVYPNESPGGWNIIGNSPISFFNAEKKTPCFAKAGDTLQFYPINKKEYGKLKNKLNNIF